MNNKNATMINKSFENERYQKIIAKLQSKSYRLTTIRKKVIKMFAEYDHVSMNMIINQLASDKKPLNVMSIYNTIDLLLKEDLIDSRTTIDKQVFYELSDNIIHVICSRCHRWIHLSDQEKKHQPFLDIKQLEKFLDKNKNFSFSHFSLEVHSICDKCQKTK